MKTEWNFRTRPYQALDAESVIALERMLYGPQYAFTAEDLEEMSQHNSEYVLWFAELTGIPLGFSCWTYLNGRAILVRLDVHPSFRRQGLAGQLLEPLDVMLLTGFVQEVLALVPERFTPMQCFLQSQGYTATQIEETTAAMFFNTTVYRFSKRQEPQKPPIGFSGGRNRIAKFLPLAGQPRNTRKGA